MPYLRLSKVTDDDKGLSEQRGERLNDGRVVSLVVPYHPICQRFGSFEMVQHIRNVTKKRLDSFIVVWDTRNGLGKKPSVEQEGE
jgi:hypothetical protein